MTTLAFWLPVIFLFAAALLGAALKRRARDACLKTFQGDLVFLKRTDGLWRTGVLRSFASGLELLYDQPRKEASGLVSSLVLHQTEVDKLTRIARPTPPEDTRAGAGKRTGAGGSASVWFDPLVHGHSDSDRFVRPSEARGALRGAATPRSSELVQVGGG